MSRYSRYDDYYDNWDGDWGWFDANIDEDREQFVHVAVPETCDDWYLTAFSVSKVSEQNLNNLIIQFFNVFHVFRIMELLFMTN